VSLYRERCYRSPTPLWSVHDCVASDVTPFQRLSWLNSCCRHNKNVQNSKNDEHEQCLAIVLTCWSSLSPFTSFVVLTFYLLQLTFSINCSFPHLVLSRVSVCQRAKRDIDIPFLSVRPFVRPSVHPTRCTIVSKLLRL